MWFIRKEGGKEMRLNKCQLEIAAKFFADLGKIWFASGVVGFFIPVTPAKLGISVLIGGIIASSIFLLLGLRILKSIDNL